MPTSTLFGLPFPAASDAPDGPGAFYALINGMETGAFAAKNWQYALGGAGATNGTGGGSDGYASRIGKTVAMSGRIVMGVSSSWGSGVPALTGVNPFGDMNPSFTFGTGWYLRASGANPIQLLFTPVNGSQHVIRLTSSGAGGAGSFPAAAQSDEIRFQFTGVLA